MATATLYPRVTATRRVMSLDGTWDFQFDPEATGEAAGWAANGLPAPVDMPVPSSFADLFTDKESREYAGDMWYVRRVFVPGEWRDMTVEARFDAATHRATVYLNGAEVASHEGGFTPFAAPLNEHVRWNAWNILAVKVNNELSMETMPLGITRTLKNGKKFCMGFFDFFNYSGLQRRVRLVATPKVRIEDLTVVTRALENLSGATATATVDYYVEVTGGSLSEGARGARGRG